MHNSKKKNCLPFLTKSTLAVLIDKLEQSVEVAGLFVVRLLFTVLEEDECWVATDTVVTAQLLLHCAVDLGGGGGGERGEYSADVIMM